MYYNGDNVRALSHLPYLTHFYEPKLQGVGPNGYSLTLFQSLATSAGFDPTQGPGSTCTSSGPCVLPWGSGTKAVSSIVLISNGVSFAVMTMLFTTLGSAADCSFILILVPCIFTVYTFLDGTFGRWLLFAVTVICWGAQFASMALTCKWIFLI